MAHKLLRPSSYPRLWRRIRRAATFGGYEHRIGAEQKFYKDCASVHELPAIFHYWSNKYLRPNLIKLGFDHPEQFFVQYLERAYLASSSSVRTFLSVGAGNCDTEVRLAQQLLTNGHKGFVIECLDLNKDMLARGVGLAESAQVAQHIRVESVDLNRWRPRKNYDAVIANQSLHHVLNLEELFQGIKESLVATGSFITSDMIGRNGHMRWPEALAIVQEYWKELPHGYRYNRLLQRQEERYINWDCSTDGFEGIRAQDILPLLIQYFHFDLFFAFANVIDPFTDRAFGHNFDAQGEWDRSFIDRVHRRDEEEIERGAIKPTHMIAALCVGRLGENQTLGGLTPEFCIRRG